MASYLKQYWVSLVVVTVFQLLAMLASLYLPTINADIIDKGVIKADIGYIWSEGLFMLLVTLGQMAAQIIATYAGAKAAMSMGRDLRRDLFAKVSGFSEQEVSIFGAPSLITRSTNDVQQVQMFANMLFTMLIPAPILAIGGIIMAIRQDAGLAWLIAVAVPVMLLILGVIVGRMVPLFRSMQAKIDNINRVMREQLTGIRVIRAFVKEKAESEKFDLANEDVTKVGRDVGRLFVLLFPIVMLTLNAASVAVIWFGGIRVDHGDIQVGTLTAFLAYLMQILMAVTMATFISLMIPRAAVCADRISEVLRTKPTVATPEHPVEMPRGTGEIEFDHVTFTYPGAAEPVLHDVSFTAKPGETTAIIGSTGAGKSTLINLVPRLFDATSGRVLVDGVDIATVNPESLWSKIGIVPQKAFLFSGTVASNLRFAKESATDEELWNALEIAQGAEFVREMAGQLDAPITQGGTNVSGGQRQRLSIARALVRRPQIYLFDDSFSALDLTTDARLRRALAQNVTDAVFLVVAQRVSSVQGASQIIVLDAGRIVGRGTHAELLETCEEYREIVESQQSADELPRHASGEAAGTSVTNNEGVGR